MKIDLADDETGPSGDMEPGKVGGNETLLSLIIVPGLFFKNVLRMRLWFVSCNYVSALLPPFWRMTGPDNARGGQLHEDFVHGSIEPVTIYKLAQIGHFECYLSMR